MAGVKKKDIPDIAAFMPEFWEFVKSVWIPEDSDQYWKEVYDKAQELYQKYPVDFVKRQILGFCEYLDQKWQSGLCILFARISKSCDYIHILTYNPVILL